MTDYTHWIVAVAELQEQRRDLLDALKDCQQLLADLARPNGEVCSLEIVSTWARCVDAEAKARAALAKATE